MSRWDLHKQLQPPLQPGDEEPDRNRKEVSTYRDKRVLSPDRNASYAEYVKEAQIGRELEELKRKERTSRWDKKGDAGEESAMETAEDGASVAPSLASSVTSKTPIEREMEWRNRYLTDEELDAMLPQEGYVIVEPPADYKPVFKAKEYKAEEKEGSEFYIAASAEAGTALVPNLGGGDESLPLFKPEDVQFFAKLLNNEKDEDSMTLEELKERKLLRLLLRIKNGMPAIRKQSLKLLTDKAQEFGAKMIFDALLPLLMSPHLDAKERHLLVKVADRMIFKLQTEVNPYVHKILVVFEPMLVDEDYYARIEGREIISNLSKAVGLATMVSVMRPDIDHVDEFVRNTTARAFSVVASALGVDSVIHFIRAVCKSKKSWQARHTGVKIVQQISILLGCGILPYLSQLVDAIKVGLEDDNQKVRIMTALALSSLAESSYPYGFESFEGILKPLYEGVRKMRGKALAAFLKAIGMIIPLMDMEFASAYSKRIIPVVMREFASPDDEMKKIVLKVVKQITQTQGIENHVIEDMVRPYFDNFWIRRMAVDRRNYKQVVETTWYLAKRVGSRRIISYLVPILKDEQESFRKMSLDCLHVIIGDMGVADLKNDRRLEELMVDGLIYVFENIQSDDYRNQLDAIGTIFGSIGSRMLPYLENICALLLWRLNNKSSRIRQEAAELIGRLAPVLIDCDQEAVLINFGKVLYENLGEEYPEVLASILVGLKGVVYTVGMQKMEPPIKDLLPRLTPILKNRHEKVQEHSIDLVGKIAERGHEHVSAREWMRICFELLETLKAPRKSIRRAAILTFGHISKAIGPQDVLVTLLNNLKVQERQLRLCTTIAIAIVAESCSPFTVLPALMNEYRTPELNVQNGVLKALAFTFEYVGDVCKDYVYAIAPLLEDALMDRDLVHRQTSCSAIKHLALGCFAADREDVLHHLLNFVWPNIFETTAHIHLAFNDAIEGLRVALGGGIIALYVIQGLFHPARKVRECYWRMFNSIYWSSQDALVPFIAPVPNEGNNTYEISEMNYLI
ncbi:hypothetical protein MP638_007439 [Amoeboaphelidium occidentale]|nr:hypothetical protein MP638_007439 [Amoeboaphelidium occidentale]